jgi:hypothetical protein
VSDDVPTPAARIEVVGGGVVSADELAAVVVALTPVGGGEDTPGPVGPPAWARAALLEGVGHRTPTRPSDLQRTTVLGD